MMSAQKKILEALSSAETVEPGLQPCILMDLVIDHTNVREYAQCYVNEFWKPKLKELMDSGWIVFRIQTELKINGHETYAYLAMMKSN